MLNEFSYQFSSNAISSVYGDNARNTRDEFGLTIPELFPENREGLIPQVSVTGLALIGANQLFDNAYKNHTFADNLTWQRGNHTWKGGVAIGFESKHELSTSVTQGAFTFARGRRPHGVPELPDRQPRRRLRRRLHVRRGASARSAPTSAGIATSSTCRTRGACGRTSRSTSACATRCYPGVTDANDLLTNFVPELFSAAARAALRQRGRHGPRRRAAATS